MDPVVNQRLFDSVSSLVTRILAESAKVYPPEATEVAAGIIKVVNNLTSTDKLSALSAAQGKVLKDLLDSISAILVSDDASLDTLQKVVTYIKQNRNSIDLLDNAVGLIELELPNKVNVNDSRLTDAREWIASTISQAEAEAGTATTRRAFTAQRVRQSIAAYTQPFTAADRAKLDTVASGAQANVATNLSYTAAINSGAVNSSTGASATIPGATPSLAGLLSNVDKAKLDGIAAGAQVNVPTNLSYNSATTNGTVVSSTGTNATIPAASTSIAGLMSNADKVKLDGIAAGAQVNVPTNLALISATTTGPTITSSTGTDVVLPVASLAVAGVVTTGDQTFAGQKNFNTTIGGDISGNAATATILQTTRTINGVPFNGSANIVINAVDATPRIPMLEKGEANGVATLDAAGKIPLSQLSDAVLGQVEYKGLWNAATNTPTLPATPTKKGDYYIVSVDGTRFGLHFEVGDWIIANGDAWGKVHNTDAVSSVAGRTGNITLTTSDIGGLGNVALINTNGSTANFLRGDGTWINPPNTTYAEISEAEISAGTASTLRTITGRRMKFALDTKADATHGHDLATTSVNGFMSSSDKTKLDGIQAGATANTGTVTSIAVNVPTGLAVTGSPVTSAGTISISYASGYSIPTTAKQGNWDTAYGWGNHASAGYLTSLAHNHGIANAGGTQQFTFGVNENIRFAASGAASIAFDPATKTITVSSTNTNTTYTAGTGLSLTGTQFSLSGVSFSAADKTKLDGIEAGAQANVATNLSYTAAATNGVVTSSTGSNATLPAATTSAAGLMTNADKSKLDGIAAGAQVNVPTNLSYTSAATNGVVVSSTGTNATIPAATTSQAGLLTGADKSKLDGIDAGAQVNAVTSVAGKTGAVVLAKADVGLSNVDNTADSSKSVASANTLTTARTINGTSFNGSANITTSSWGTARNVTIGGTTRSVNGSTNLTWSLSDIGALGTSGSQKIVKPAHADNSDAYHLELNSPEGSSVGEVSLRFHQDNRFYGQIRMRTNGFHFTQGHSGEYRDLYAGAFNGDLVNKGWKRFHLATNESTPLPPANSGPGRWFVRLSPANTVSQTYAGRVTVNGGWSYSAIMGICEKEFSFHYDGAAGALKVVDNRVSALTGAAADNIRIGDITIVSGFVGFYIWSNDSNVPFVQLDLYNYPTDARPTVTGWEADSFPVRTPVTYFDLDISGTGRNIHFRSSPLGVRRGVVGVVANNDYWSVYGGGDTSDGGYMDIATGDNGTEPIYVSQFSGGSPIPVDGVTTGSLVRRAALLNEAGNTSFPGTVTSSGMFCNGAFHQAEGVSTGTVNGAQANVWQINDPGSTRTISITNTEGMLGSLTYILRMVGNRATNWPANVNWSRGPAPNLGPNWTIVVLTRINDTWFGSIGPSR